MTSTTFRIVAVDPLPDNIHEIFIKQLPSDKFTFECPKNDGDQELEGMIQGAQALVTRHRSITSELMAKVGDPLKLIQVMGRLPDRVDLGAARKLGVPVAVMPHGGAIAVAEHAMALMLAMARVLLPGHRGVVEGKYSDRGLSPKVTSEWEFAFNWLGFDNVTELRGKTLGLVGLGEIGREVARRAKSFDMVMLYNQRHRIPERYEHLLGVRKVPLEDLLRDSDFVSLHVPHTPATEQLLDVQKLALMKPNACLINTARGGLVDEDALVDWLRDGKIAGAGLDVFVKEPLPAGHPLMSLPNVVLAPHVGGGSGGGQRKLIGQVLENIARVAEGGTPINEVKATDGFG